MKRAIPLIILLGVAAGLAVGWMAYGERVMSMYYTGRLERALSESNHEKASEIAERLVGLEPENRNLRLRASGILAVSERYSRAEYHLLEAIALGGPKQAEIYAALSELYVRQDKLMDAVDLLDNVRGLSAEAVGDLRPEAPIPASIPGVYEQDVLLSFTVPEGCVCYYSLTEEYPTVQNPWTKPVLLPPGRTVVRAVALDASGVASVLWTGEYVLDSPGLPAESQEPDADAGSGGTS